MQHNWSFIHLPWQDNPYKYTSSSFTRQPLVLCVVIVAQSLNPKPECLAHETTPVQQRVLCINSLFHGEEAVQSWDCSPFHCVASAGCARGRTCGRSRSQGLRGLAVSGRCTPCCPLPVECVPPHGRGGGGKVAATWSYSVLHTSSDVF